MNPGLDGQAMLGQSGAEILRVLFKFVAQLSGCGEKLERLQGRRHDRRRNRIGKQIRARALPQKINNLFTPAGKTAARAAERFAQRACDDVDLAHYTAILVCATSCLTEKSGRVRVVDHRQRTVFLCELNHRLEVSNGSV